MDAGAADRSLVFNGIDGSTGEYLLPAVRLELLAKVARGETLDDAELKELRFKKRQSKAAMLGVVPGVDPNNLEQAGWGVIFAADSPPEVREALAPLLELRKEEATKVESRFYRELKGTKGYRPGESKADFLARHGVGPGPADPEKMPYYLLIVGDPESIPYRFQYQLDVQYAVGRISFDTAEEYAQYASSVVAAERGKVRLPKRAVFFGVANDDDDATVLSSTELVPPLVEALEKRFEDGDDSWDLQSVPAAKTTKRALSKYLGDDRPALLFTASHGMGFPRGHARQLGDQGALLCRDWKGPLKARGPISPDWYFAADDISSDAELHGMVTFMFACYGAGTPRMDDFAQMAFRDSEPIAERPFVAALPQRMLSHPKGGALAVVGHVERAWGYSFYWDRAGRQLQTFRATLEQLLHGFRIGAALEFFNVRYAELASDLTDELHEIRLGQASDDFALAGMWTACHDARNYMLLGDPAVRLPI
jgi:hypothetical protein